MKYRILSLIFCTICLITNQSAQSFFAPSDTLSKTRLYTALAATAISGTSIGIGLYNTWYRKFDSESFHFFNDWGEWRFMDKAGHLHTAYFQGNLAFKGGRWTGLNKKQSIWTGVIGSTILQGTVEVFDGFSSKWGFSISDMAANFTGTSLFALQQHFWDEQKILIKISSYPKKYNHSPILSTDGLGMTELKTRSGELFGVGFFEKFLKDYNEQTYWASFNINSLLYRGNNWPSWLNIAVGYGVQNLFGGFDNHWVENNRTYELNLAHYARYSQLYISPDIDFTKIKTRSPFIKSLLTGLNIFKMPMPAIEINTQGQVIFHILK